MTTVDSGSYRRFVQLFYDPLPKNDGVAKLPIWCLGREYDSTCLELTAGTKYSSDPDVKPEQSGRLHSDAELRSEGNTSSIESSMVRVDIKHSDTSGWPEEFLDDFEARIWLTYRSNFAMIPRPQDPSSSPSMTLAVRLRNLADRRGFTSDTGFGCMIRSGQSLLANALCIQQLGRDWRRGQCQHEERALLSLFADDVRAPYSIHNFVELGATSCGKCAGEWFGPSATAYCIQELVNKNPSTTLRIYVTGDGSDVYEDSFMKVACAKGDAFAPTLILVGTRLGIDKVNPLYYEGLLAALKLPQSIGIAGGRHSAAHYFVGVQGSDIFYLDPHNTRSALPWYDDADMLSESAVDSCHTRRLRLLNVKDMDPSMLFGYLIKDENDWQDWRRRIATVPGKPVIHVAIESPNGYGRTGMRDGAVDDVESLDEEEEEDEGEDGENQMGYEGKEESRASPASTDVL